MQNGRIIALAVELGEDAAIPFVVPQLCLEHKPSIPLGGEIEDKAPVLAGHLLDGGRTLKPPRPGVSELVNDGPRVHLERCQEASNYQEAKDGPPSSLHVDDKSGPLPFGLPGRRLPTTIGVAGTTEDPASKDAGVEHTPPAGASSTLGFAPPDCSAAPLFTLPTHWLAMPLST